MSRVGVLPYKQLYGAKNINGPHVDGDGEPIQLIELERYSIFEIADKEFETAAHFTCYEVAGVGDDESWPRINKECLQSVREAGHDIVSNLLVMDWDIPYENDSKTAMREDHLNQFALMLFDHTGEIANWCMAYTTKHGGRIVYQMPVSVSVEAQENLVLALVKAWERVGVGMDEACKDWTRAFLCPRVIRDGLKTSDSEFFCCEVRENVFLDPESLLDNYKDVRKQVISESRVSQEVPQGYELDGLLFSKAGRSRKQTEFYKKAKACLRNSMAYQYAFEEIDIPQGSRNDTLMKIFGSVVPTLLRNYKDLTAEHVFALFYDKIACLAPDTGTPCWITHAWKNALGSIWRREVPKYNDECARNILLKKEKKAKSTDAFQRIADGMRVWCDEDQLHSEQEEDWKEFVREYCIVSAGTGYFVLGVDGEFDSFPVKKETLIAKLRKSHLSNVLTLQTTNTQGDVNTVSAQSIIDNHCVVASDGILYKPQIKCNGYVDDITGHSPKLVLPMYRRNPNLEAQYDQYVDAWLSAFFGEHYEEATNWIGHALAFEDGPICALSIKGPGGIGKKILTQGLAECLEVPKLASKDSLTDRFNDDIARTPFMAVNEGLDNSRGAGDRFKSLTAGDSISVEAKFKSKCSIINPMRIIFTANDHDLIYALADGKPLTPESRKAIGDRLLHYDLGGGAIAYLNSIGGRRHTGKDGARWIRDDNGNTPSDFVVAKHFLWLYENREPSRNERLLVMGNAGGNAHTMYDMVLQKPATSMCIRAIVQLSNTTKQKAMRIDSETGRVFVTVDGLHNYVSLQLDNKITIRDVQGALRTLALSEEGKVVNFIKWVEIDCHTVLRYSEDVGIDASTIRGCVAKQQKLI